MFSPGPAFLQSLPQQVIDLSRRIVKARQCVQAVAEDEIKIATTPKDALHRDGPVTLYHYRPMVEAPLAVPVLLVYALVGRFTVADLQTERSLIQKLLEQGLDIYAIDWGHPTRADMGTTLDDYINGYIGECVEIIAERHNLQGINLLGICQGGIFNLCYAALHPDRVNTVIATVAPIDFHAAIGDEQVDRGFIHVWARACKESDIDLLIDGVGNLSGELMAQAFGLMTPISHHAKYSLALLDLVEDETKLKNFLRMERWLNDRPAHTAASARQWLKDFYQGNKLYKGELELGGQRVDLGRIKAPVLNIYGEHDLIAPPETSKALRHIIGSKDYTELAFPGGHIGLFVGSRAQKTLAPAIADWLKARR